MKLRWFQVDKRVVAMAHLSAEELEKLGLEIGENGPSPGQVQQILRGVLTAQGSVEALPPVKELVGYHLEPLGGGILVALQAEARTPRRKGPRSIVYQFTEFEWLVAAAERLDQFSDLQVSLYVLPATVGRRWFLRVMGPAAILRQVRTILSEFGEPSPFRVRELNRVAETIIADGMPILRTQFSR